MAVTYVKNANGIFEPVSSVGFATDTTLSLSGKPADAAATGNAIAAAAALKVDKVSGKDLSTNDYTNSDKNFVDALRYTDLGYMNGKTITDLKTALANWIDEVHNIPGARAVFRGANHVQLWNDNDTTTTISAGSAWTVEIKTYYNYGEYAQIEMCNYTDRWVYYVVLSNNTWGKIRRVAFDADIVNKTTLTNIFGAYHDLTTTVTPGPNYSSASGSTTLVGNMLRVKFSADRSTAANGNIDNEVVANFSVTHGGKITGGFAVCIGNGTSGHLANMVVSSVKCNETTLTFSVTLTATAGDTSTLNPFFAMPVLIDITKF